MLYDVEQIRPNGPVLRLMVQSAKTLLPLDDDVRGCRYYHYETVDTMCERSGAGAAPP